MKKSYAKVDPSEIKQIEFDGTKLCSIATDEAGEPEGPWLLIEPGSDEHIAILEQMIEAAVIPYGGSSVPAATCSRTAPRPESGVCIVLNATWTSSGSGWSVSPRRTAPSC